MLMKASGELEIAPIEDSWSWRLLVRRADRAASAASTVVSGMIAALFSEMVADGVFRWREPADRRTEAASVAPNAAKCRIGLNSRRDRDSFLK
jgi:hypothetical protein